MCLCESCSWLDEWCWPLEKKAFFIAIWTIVHAAIFLIMDFVFFILSILDKESLDFTFIFSIPHLIGGILMLIAIKKSKAGIYLAGLILSSFFPFIFFPFIYMAVMQIIYIMIGCRYYSTVLK